MAYAIRIGAYPELLAEAPIAEHLRNLGEKLQVLLGRVLGDEEHQHFRHGLPVGRLKGYWQLEPHVSRHGLLQVLDACMRQRDALAQAGGAQFLARGETLEHLRLRKTMAPLEEPTDFLENALLGRDVQVEQDVLGRQHFGNGIQGR